MLTRDKIELAEARRLASADKLPVKQVEVTLDDIIKSMPPELLAKCTIKRGNSNGQKIP